MSEFSDIIGDVVDDRATGTTDPIVNLRTGATFVAEIEGNVDPAAIAYELGEDVREVVILHVRNAADAAGINHGDRVQFALFGQTAIHRVVKRRQNPGNPFTEFWAKKIVPGKDS